MKEIWTKKSVRKKHKKKFIKKNRLKNLKVVDEPLSEAIDREFDSHFLLLIGFFDVPEGHRNYE